MLQFGQNPTYVYGEVFGNKFSTPDKGYKIDSVSFEPTECPAKIIGDSAVIFFEAPIFNTLVESVEENVTILRSFDSKRTIIKEKLLENKLYTVKAINETEKLREVVLYKFDSLFPGYKCSGSVELIDGKPHVVTSIGKGSLVLQRNDVPATTECILYKIEDGKYSFVEVNNPIKRCRAVVVKSLNKNKLVESGAIKGILLKSNTDVKEGDEVDLYVHRVCLGSYVFVEDIKLGPASVELVGKVEDGSGGYTVIHGIFTGVCYDKKVSKKMKGNITKIEDSKFIFTQDTKKSNKEEADIAEKPKEAEQKRRKTDTFIEVKVDSHMISDDKETVDQYKVIEMIKNKIEENENVMPLFNKYISLLDRKDELCIFYLKYLEETNRVEKQEVARIAKITSKHFLKAAPKVLESKVFLEYIFKIKKTEACFLKLLEMSKDKKTFISNNKEFIKAAVKYLLQNEKNPRPTIESVIGTSYSGWIAYIDNETNKAQKRGLFRRILEIKTFKKEQVKEVFQKWHEFEAENGGNTDEVEQLAKEHAAKFAALDNKK